MISTVYTLNINFLSLMFLTDEDLDELLILTEEIVFARTSPEQKLKIVEGCQASTLRCLKRDTGLSFGTFQAGCIGLY